MTGSFWNLSYPFRDFLIITSKEGDIKDKLLSHLESQSKNINLSIKKINQFNNISNYIITDNLNKSIDDLNKEKVFFSGVGQFGGNLYYGQKDIDNKADINCELFDSTGLFTCVSSCKSEIIIKHDYFGCGLLYYFERDNYFLVSNRYHLLLIMIAAMGYKLKINMTKVACNFYSHTNLLGSNIFNQMDMDGIYQLPIANYIRISHNGYEIKERLEYINSLEGKINETYNDLLLKSKYEIIENIKAILNSNNFNKYVVDLSGGMDSRATFAGVLNIAELEEKTELRVVDVKSSDDLEIALKINSMFGYAFYRKDKRLKRPVTLKESLDMWSSYFMGTYHRMGIGAYSVDQSKNKMIRLSGGMGEFYRASGYKAYKKYIGTPNTIDELIDNFMLNLPPLLKSVDNYKDKIKDLLKKQINNTNGKTLEDKFSNFYFIKFRYHFGMRAWEYYHSGPIYFPLMSKSALKAVMLLNINDISRGKFMIDITDKLSKELLSIDYNNEKYNENMLLKEFRDNNQIKDLNMIDTKDIKEKWLQIQDYNKQIEQESEVKSDKEFYESWRYSDKYIYSELINLYYKIKTYNEDLNYFFNDEFLELIHKLKDNKYRVYEMYSKLRSINDQIEEFI